MATLAQPSGGTAVVPVAQPAIAPTAPSTPVPASTAAPAPVTQPSQQATLPPAPSGPTSTVPSNISAPRTVEPDGTVLPLPKEVPAIFSSLGDPAKLSPWQLQVIGWYLLVVANPRDTASRAKIVNTQKAIMAAALPWTAAYQTQYGYMVKTFAIAYSNLPAVPGAVATPAPVQAATTSAAPTLAKAPAPAIPAATTPAAGASNPAAPTVKAAVNAAATAPGPVGYVAEVEHGFNVFLGWLGAKFSGRA